MIARCLIVSAAACALCAPAAASPLNLQRFAFPDIAATQVDVRYNASLSSLALTASGFSVAYEDDGLVSTPVHTIFGGQFNINMTVSNAGVPSGGTLSILGSIPDLSIPHQVLLSGTLLDFGFTTSGAGRLEFLFGSLGGVLAPTYLTHGNSAAVILNNINGFPHHFNSSWDNLVGGQAGTGSAVADAAAIPGAPSAALLGLGLAFAGGRRRRR